MVIGGTGVDERATARESTVQRERAMFFAGARVEE